MFAECELEKSSTFADFATVQNEGDREVERQIEHYNLDVIISVGFRGKYKQVTQFRIWANKILKDYLFKGYAINEKRLAQKEQEVGLKVSGTDEYLHQSAKKMIKTKSHNR